MLSLAVRYRIDGGAVMGFFTDVMTVYNYRRDDAGEHWLRSVVHGVQWRHGKRRVTVSDGVVSDVPEESITIDFRKQYEGNKPYLHPLEYQKTAEDEADGFWTLDESNGMDVVVYGEIIQEITSEYGISRLRKEYPAFTVTSVADNRNRSRLKHIKVVAK